jgi:hypothetical protein
LIDTENISVASQNMKFVGEQADIFQYQWYSHSDDIIIILICIFAGKNTWFKIFKIRFSKTVVHK